MRAFFALILLALLGLVLQSSLGRLVPARLGPDIGFLYVVGLGLVVTSMWGLFLAMAAGYAADLLGGALLGEHAVLFLLIFGITRLANLRMDLFRPFPLVIYVFVLSLFSVVLVGGIRVLIGEITPFALGFSKWIPIQALSNALVAWFVVVAVRGVATHLAEDSDTDLFLLEYRDVSRSREGLPR